MADERDAVATRPDPSEGGKVAKSSKAAREPKRPKRPESPKVRAEKRPESPKVKTAKPPKSAKPPKLAKVKAEKPPKPQKTPKPPKPAKVKAEKLAKPPKAPPSAATPKPAAPAKVKPTAKTSVSQREPLAPIAFVASLLAGTTAGIAAIPALLLARKAKHEIAVRPGATGLGLATAATVIAVIFLVGWASVGAFALARAIRPSGVDYAELKVGDCIETPAGDEVRRVDVVTCDGPHDAEVFAVVTHPAPAREAFPGVPALLEFAADACLGQAFVDYVGVPRIRSQLTDYEFVPGEEGWSEGRRDLVCVVDSSDGLPLSGSVKGSRR